MGLLDAMMGNASKVDIAGPLEDFGHALAEGETIEHAYQLFRDMFLFTNRRLILVDRQGLTGSKMEMHSIPYRSITHFSVETAGMLDFDAELKIWISGSPHPVQKKFNKKLSIYEVQGVLAAYVAR